MKFYQSQVAGFGVLALSFQLKTKGIVILKICQEIHRINPVGVIP